MRNPQLEAQANFFHFSGIKNPGRFGVFGRSADGKKVIHLYGVTGRSAASRNRVLVVNGETVSTDYADPSKADHSKDHLVIYDAMMQVDGIDVTSNGRQTAAVARDILEGPKRNLAGRLLGWSYEDDSNATPRITAATGPEGGSVELAILTKASHSKRCETAYFEKDLMDGFGWHFRTYLEDADDPLPSFRGEPLLMPLLGTPEEILRRYWDALDHDNRVAMVAKTVDIESGEVQIQIENKYEKVPA